MTRKKMNKLKILITTGDPLGIGPEISVKAAIAMQHKCTPILIGSRKDFGELPCEFIDVCGNSFDYVKKAVELLQTGEYSKLVTAPISKKNWQDLGVPYPAHTEALAALTNTQKYAMIFANSKAKVVLTTRHIAIKDVPQAFNQATLNEAIEVGIDFLNQLGIKNKRIGICSLNPHGDENCSVDILIPKYKNVEFIGPTSGDALFQKAVLGTLDLIVAAYHDQGIFPLKAMDYYRCVNITIGLPFVRVSPGHGTAFDIAGKNIANPDAMIEAIDWALRLGGSKQISA